MGGGLEGEIPGGTDGEDAVEKRDFHGTVGVSIGSVSASVRENKTVKEKKKTPTKARDVKRIISRRSL